MFCETNPLRWRTFLPVVPSLPLSQRPRPSVSSSSTPRLTRPAGPRHGVAQRRRQNEPMWAPLDAGQYDRNPLEQKGFDDKRPCCRAGFARRSLGSFQGRNVLESRPL